VSNPGIDLVVSSGFISFHRFITHLFCNRGSSSPFMEDDYD
jgi:hypothetical protein